MLYLIDTANVKDIKRCCEFFPIAGVTTNPTIISREKADVRELIYTIRDIIGDNRMLHVQTTAAEAAEIVKDAELLRSVVGENFYIKIPITSEGLKATAICKDKGIGVTMTAIFTQQQAMLASAAGADFVAPYINRLDNIVSDGVHVVDEIVTMFEKHKSSTRVLAASFKTVEQVHKICLTGAHCVTINPEVFDMLTYHPLTYYAIDAFEKDWEEVYGKKKLPDLI